MCTHFSYKMVHYEIWDWCILGFAQQVYRPTCWFAIKAFEKVTDIKVNEDRIKRRTTLESKGNEERLDDL